MEHINRITEYIDAVATMNVNADQHAFFEQQKADARPVQCVRMCDVFTPGQLEIIRDNFKCERKQCYKNASLLMTIIAHPFGRMMFPQPAKYVEGFFCEKDLFPIEHAFVKVGDKYIDPTAECALHLDVRQIEYVSLIELDAQTMARYQNETGYYGNLYKYHYLTVHHPEFAKKWRELGM